MTTPAPKSPELLRQIAAFGGVGVLAMIAHYGALVALVEGFNWDKVQATLVGYVAGGILSYWLNRRLTYASERPHSEAGWRFIIVAGIGFAITWGLMHLFIDRLGLAHLYLVMQLITTLIVMSWSFVAHKLFTFGG
jgi:putative flippase GtrA